MQALLWKTFKFLLMSLGALLLLGMLLFVGANLWVLGKTHGRIEHELPLCGPERVGIVFGTSHWTRSGVRNPHFDARINAASRLLRLGRVEHLLLSGDNRTRQYNEPITMWRDLRSQFVRDEDMTLDYAGFSTFDTLARARDVFGVEQALLVTQAWHLPRALFIADALGLEARGCGAPSRPVAGLWRLQAREWVARAATVGDLYLWGREPYFLGPLEPLQIVPPAWRQVIDLEPELKSTRGDSRISGDAVSAAGRVRESTPGTPSSTARPPARVDSAADGYKG